MNDADGAGPSGSAPFRSGPYVVRPEWIDYNGHLNLAYYLVLFDRATDALWERLGLGAGLRDGGHGTFAAESHILYKAELLERDAVVVGGLVLGADGKRLHIAFEMSRTRDGIVAAQQEIMYLCVDLGRRRAAPWPEAIFARLQEAAATDSQSARPDWVGRRVAMPSPV